jgi:hypothetical protein
VSRDFLRCPAIHGVAPDNRVLNNAPGAGTALIRLAGGFRPVVGAIFGLALYIFIEAGLFPIKLTVTGQKLTYFYLGVAFLAGFSERLAQDAITKAGTVIGSNSSQEEPSGEKPS